MSSQKCLTGIAIALLIIQATPAKTLEQQVKWQDLPKSLIGQNVKVAEAGHHSVSGKLIGIEADRLLMQHGKNSLPVLRGAATTLEVHSRVRTRGQIIGATTGAAPGIFLTWLASVYKRNEGGVNADAIVGAAVGIAAAGAALGYFAGRASDTDKTIFHIIP